MRGEPACILFTSTKAGIGKTNVEADWDSRLSSLEQVSEACFLKENEDSVPV